MELYSPEKEVPRLIQQMFRINPMPMLTNQKVQEEKKMCNLRRVTLFVFLAMLIALVGGCTS
jgi:hypothetical protein